MSINWIEFWLKAAAANKILSEKRGELNPKRIHLEIMRENYKWYNEVKSSLISRANAKNK